MCMMSLGKLGYIISSLQSLVFFSFVQFVHCISCTAYCALNHGYCRIDTAGKQFISIFMLWVNLFFKSE